MRIAQNLIGRKSKVLFTWCWAINFQLILIGTASQRCQGGDTN